VEERGERDSVSGMMYEMSMKWEGYMEEKGEREERVERVERVGGRETER
jgi:hypothetical protein